MKSLFLSLFSLSLLFVSPLGAHAAVNKLEIILDASGSMEARIGGQRKFDIARDALNETLTGLTGLDVGLRVYGHHFSNAPADQARSCQDSELLVPFGENNGTAIRSAIATLSPHGYTPMAYSLEQAGNDLRAFPDAEHFLVLLSDGEETCGGDPAAVVAALRASGINVTVHVIGFDVDAETRAQLEGIARAGGGQYFQAGNAEELQTSLETLTTEGLVQDKEAVSLASDIRVEGGSNFTDAVVYPDEARGVEVSLVGHLRRQTYETFTLALQAGEAVQVTVRSGNEGIRIDTQGNPVASQHVYAGATLYNSARTRVGAAEVIDEAFGEKTLTFTSPEAQTVYLFLGSNYSDVHRDSRFLVEVVNPEDILSIATAENPDGETAGMPDLSGLAPALQAAEASADALRGEGGFLSGSAIWIATALGGLLILLAIVVGVMMMKKKKE